MLVFFLCGDCGLRDALDKLETRMMVRKRAAITYAVNMIALPRLLVSSAAAYILSFILERSRIIALLRSLKEHRGR